MTTIILTIIGILLAAVAALMIIFYGGDAFNKGSIGAQANTLQNAGTNVISATELAKTDGNSYTAVADLVTNQYLKEAPALPGVATTAALTATDYTVALTGTDADAVCDKVESNLGHATPSSAVGTYKMGCFKDATNGDTFYAHL